ncbi:MAG: hypothetical protein ACLT1K_02405 [[Clostridium] leptum]
MSKSGKIALEGLLTALGVVLMFLTGLIPIGTYALPAIAGVLLIVAVIEIGAKWAWMIYAAVAVLSLLFAADKEAALLFVLFFGYYPVLKTFLERISNKVLSWISKFAVFNVAVVACFFLAVNFLQLPEDSFTVFGIYLPWVFLILVNAVFLIYDIALSGLVATYVEKLHHRVTKTLK